jgi:hypothetical protein
MITGLHGLPVFDLKGSIKLVNDAFRFEHVGLARI